MSKYLDPKKIIESLNEIRDVVDCTFDVLRMQIQDLESDLRYAGQKLDNAGFKISLLEARNQKLEIELSKRHCSDWHRASEQRDANGEFTPLAMALQALSDHGCDCFTDEPGTCLGCLCEAAIKDLLGVK